MKSRVLVDVAHPREDAFYERPEDLDSFPPGGMIDARSDEVRALRRVIDADAWRVTFRSNDVGGDPSWGVTTVLVPRRAFRGLLASSRALD